MSDSIPPSAPATETCFVVMGFGKKTDFETGRVLDLDASYQALIKPAVEAAGLRCIRADEIKHSGLIDDPMYELLLTADVVVADLSTSNRNAIYELGVRHALRPYTTVIIAEEGIMKSPFFDLSHIVIRTYKHLGEDIGVREMQRFTAELTAAIKDIRAKEPSLRRDSPVYRFLERLDPPSLRKEIENAARQATLAVAPPEVPDAGTVVYSELMRQADEAEKATPTDWARARTLLEGIRTMRKAIVASKPADEQTAKAENPYILQRLARATYKCDPKSRKALEEARDLLALLEPETSNDPETLGLWGAVHKQLWLLTGESEALDKSIRGYERGFYLRNDYYNGINYAFLLNLRASVATSPAEAIADFVQAGRVRSEVVGICQQWVAANPAPNAELDEKQRETKYWVLATLAEAYVGRGDASQGDDWMAQATAVAPKTWMAGTTQQQLDKLRTLLADSPLRHLQPGVAPGIP